MSVRGDSNQPLRKRAEAILRDYVPGDVPLPGDVKELIYELQVHQVELEMQNDAMREAQVELEVSRGKYRDLFELAPVGYLSLNQHGKISDANYAAAGLLQQERQQLIGKRVTTFVAKEHTERFARHRKQVFAGAARSACEIELESKSGRRREVRIESVRASAATSDWLMTVVDLTEVHRLGRELEQARRLEAIGTLASGVAHDFNNLLMAVLGCADIALDRLTVDSAAHAPLASLKQAVLRGRTVVSQLLTFAKSKDAVDATVVLDSAVSECAAMLRQTLGEAIALRLELRAEGARVRTGVGQLQQVLMNLASNARDAMPRGGTLTSETCLLAEDGGRLGAPPRARLCVADNGTGMDADTLTRAFEPFFTTKPAGEGTGLGLSMVYGAVQQAGGQIELDSRPGAGTRANIDWPLAERVTRSSAPPPPKLAPVARGLRLLLVEDERLVRLAMRHYLDKAGFQVTEAATGEAALELLDGPPHGPQVLVSDVVLPGIKGPQVGEAARKRWPEIGVVLVSAHAPELLVQRGFIAAGTHVLRKPFTPEELYAAIERSLLANAAVG